jgi:hypothetical protein
LYIYAVSLEAPFAAFQWSSSSCAKLSTPVQVVFLRPITTLVSTPCSSGNVGFTVSGGLNAFDASLPANAAVVLSNGTATYNPSSIVSAGVSPNSFLLNFTGIASVGSSSYTLTVTDPNGCKVTKNVSCVLAVTLGNFSGIAFDDYNQLSWTTMIEQENNYFKIEVSNDGVNFRSVAQVPSKGNSNSMQNYTYRDIENNYEVAYYRLVMIDNDGYAETSPIISIERTAISAYQIINMRPQPANELIYFDIKSLSNDQVQFIITDMNGKKIVTHNQEISAGLSTQKIDLSKLDKGMYFITLSGSKGISTKRLIKE